MRRRRKTDLMADTVLVTTDDGQRLRCSVTATGRETEPRWVLMDEQAEQYLGPPVLSDHSPDAVRRQIVEWWKEQHSVAAANPPAATQGSNGPRGATAGRSPSRRPPD